MKLICGQNQLKEAFQTAERFTGKNPTLPVLANIFFEASGKKARLVATNLEMGIEITVPCKVEKEGSATVPGKLVNSLIHSVDEDTVTLEENNSGLNLKTGTSRFSIRGMPAKDFPLLPKIKKEHEFTVGAMELRNGLSRVLPGVAVSDFKPELGGVFMKRDARSFVLAATDSFRLAEKVLPAQHSTDMTSFIVPGRTCQELLRTLPEEAGEVAIREGEGQIYFETGEMHIVSRLVDGTYPDYASIIPKEFESHLSAGKDELVKKIKAASVLSSKLNDIILNFSAKEAFVEAANSETGTSTIRISAKVKGRGGKVSFNFRYLLDGLEAVSGEEVLISFNGDAAPALISDPSDPSFRYVVMPIRNA